VRSGAGGERDIEERERQREPAAEPQRVEDPSVAAPFNAERNCSPAAEPGRGARRIPNPGHEIPNPGHEISTGRAVRPPAVLCPP